MAKVFLFPGQGAQYPGMAEDLFSQSDRVQEYFEIASTVLQKDMKSLLFRGSEEELKSTNNTQVAITLANISASAVIQEQGIAADIVLGFSIGECAALHEAGVIDTETLFNIVKIRGDVMERASRMSDEESAPSAMTAVIGLAFEEAQAVIRGMDSKKVFIANHSSPTQIVLAGTASGLDEAETELNNAGAMRIIRLQVSGPFHSPLLMGARNEFEEQIAEFSFADPKLPVISNVSACPIQTGEDARKLAAEQITSMVRWVESEQYLVDNGYISGAPEDAVFEVGPGKVLCGLWKAFNKTLRAQVAGTIENIEKLEKK